MINKDDMYEVKSSKSLGKEFKKRLITLSLVFTLATSLTTGVNAATKLNPDIYVNDSLIAYEKDKGVSYFDKNNETLVPLKWAMESLGYVVSYDSKTGTATLRAKNKTIYLMLEKDYFVYNGNVYKTASQIVINENKLYIPLTTLATIEGATIEWNENSNIANLITDTKEVIKERIKDLDKVIDKNSNLYYSDKNTIKSYLKNYYEFMNPTMEEHNSVIRKIASLTIERKYESYDIPVTRSSKNTITFNMNKLNNIAFSDALRNELTRYMFPKENVLLDKGMTELLSAEINKDVTNQDLDMVNVTKMLSDIIGKDTLLKAYKENDMSIIKKSLMDIYEDESLYNNFETLIDRIYEYNYADTNNTKVKGERSTDFNDKFVEDVANIYGILDVYYQCSFGYEIMDDDVMEGYYNEMLTHGKKKSFKEEPRIYVGDTNYSIIYRNPQNGYNYGYSSYYYYDKSRPINNKGNGEVLRLIK